jgi:hypothetical protein
MTFRTGRPGPICRKNGKDVTHLEVLRALENSIHEGADMKIDCTEAAKRLFSPA